MLSSVITRLLALSLLLLPLLANATTGGKFSTSELFDKYKTAIVQIKITNILSDEKAGLGTGFFVTEQGHVLTNYHVIAEKIHKPENYKIELVTSNEATDELELLNIDVIHDLAILKAKQIREKPLKLSDRKISKGTHIASLGNPHDLGMTIVDGLYSGLLQNSLYEKIHFSGSINPGMSGGPAVIANGKVIGVNVATAGNAISFLVPARYAIALLDRSLDSEAENDFYNLMARQLKVNQETLTTALLENPGEPNKMGEYQVPGSLSPFLKCWGDSDEDRKKYYGVITKSCSTSDEIYIDGNYRTGSVFYSHKHIYSKKLNAVRFASLYESYFGRSRFSGNSKYFTNPQCYTAFVDIDNLKTKSGMCLRGHKKFPGIYDVQVIAATLNSEHSGLQTNLVVKGVSYTNAIKIMKNYLKAITWQE